ncbi:hypothetical protein [Sporosalibacterium faouarense]|uniref:hypothetical protein n=1 Tax=Sporosalibacterium faouarense TaxID=516123 RepID=UPI00192B5577|nr:hypothetical protein [Sporosalibacterium faouarense]
MDSVSKLFSIMGIVFIVILILLLIFFILKIEQDQVIKDATKDFNERVRFEGYITRDMYENYMERISIKPLEIRFRHIKYKIDSSNREVLTIYTQREIIDEIYNNPNKIYKLEKHDEFIVQVKELQPSIFEGVMQILTKSLAKPHIIVSKGGVVHNESYR